MYARILTKDGRDYFGTVFALIGTGWETAAITFDSQKQQFDYTAMYDVRPSLVRKVFIVDTDETNWQTYNGMQAKGLRFPRGIGRFLSPGPCERNKEKPTVCTFEKRADSFLPRYRKPRHRQS